jgi:hypothetical protein
MPIRGPFCVPIDTSIHELNLSAFWADTNGNAKLGSTGTPPGHWVDIMDTVATNAGYLGSGLMMFGAGALMLALVQVGNSGEMATIAALAASGVVALLALAAHERSAAETILPLKLWRDRVIAVGSLSGFTGGMVMMSINAFLPLYVQGAMGRKT